MTIIAKEPAEMAGLDKQCVNTIRFLAVDAVQKANSGHPGAPLGQAVMAYILWDRFLKHNPANPKWFDRDRFILSAGHASAMLYSMLHLTGYDLPLEEIKNFRQLHSKTPGHPEYGHTPGIETTTGPLGQGFAHGVGMALAEKWMAANYNRDGHEIVSHYTYAIVSDGDLQEGVASEAASLAGSWKLGKLIYLYDDNDIQIEGSTDTNFREDVAARFSAYGWHVVGPINGFDPEAVENAIKESQNEKEKPSLVICKTIIGYGSPEQNTAGVHGSPLGEENVRKTRENLGWPAEPAFLVPEEVSAHMRKALERGNAAQESWENKIREYGKKFPDLAEKFKQQAAGKLPDSWDEGLEELFPEGSSPIATRNASGKILNAIAKKVPFLMGGSADLGPSNKTEISGEEFFSAETPEGRNIHFGVREHAMGSITAGMALHGGVIPYTGTFLTFADYMRPPIRLAAMMGIRVVYIFSHDSIGLGEDGPTHQPVEQLMSLRIIPNLTVIRPADARETVEAWKSALTNENGPTVLVLTRQDLPLITPVKYGPAEHSRKGAYTLWQADRSKPDLIIMGTGSEVEIALEAGKILGEKGINARVVSMPSWELFQRQPREYRDQVLPPDVRACISVEAGVTLGWQKYTGLDGTEVGLDRFGASAPYKELYREFGITVENVVKNAFPERK